MALSTLRLAMRPCLSGTRSLIPARSAPMATSAHEQMKQFWEKNQRLQRPNSPWMIYWPHLPMMTSLTHRTTGIVMGVTLYGLSIGLFIAPGDFPHYVELIKSLGLSSAILFPAKAIVAFPLVYHYINGIRHLSWDAGKGYELATQYKTGWTIVTASILISAMFASMAYW